MASTKAVFATARDRALIVVTCGRAVTSGMISSDWASSCHRSLRVRTAKVSSHAVACLIASSKSQPTT